MIIVKAERVSRDIFDKVFMFTGLIEAVCTVRAIGRRGEGMRLEVDLSGLGEQPEIGESVAINGACLTVSGLCGSIAAFDVSGETLSKSSLGEVGAGRRVNVEPAVAAGGRFGGHFVQGHVDGTGEVISVERTGEFAEIRFRAERELLEQMVAKGSVAVDGISLTIAGLEENSFSVAVIPETLKKTTLGTAKIGDRVNIETDIIVKVVKRQLERIAPCEGLTVEKLQEMGF